MAVGYWQDVSIMAGAYEAASQAKAFQASVDVAPLDITPLSVTNGFVVLMGGNKSGSWSIDLMSDMAQGGQNEILNAQLGVAGVPKSFTIGSADGSTSYMMNTIPLSYTAFEGDPGGLALAKLSGQATGPVVRGVLLHPGSTARTASGTGVARQLGAVPAEKKVYAALHVLAASGTTPSLTVAVQSDNAVGFPSPTTVATFNAATATGYQWTSVAGAITDDWWRVTWTISGTSPSFLFGVTVGIL